MRIDSRLAPAESNKHSSTAVPSPEKTAKFTPSPSHVAPSGCGEPGLVRMICSAPSDESRNPENVPDTLDRVQAHVIAHPAPNIARPGQQIGHLVRFVRRDAELGEWDLDHGLVR